MEYNRYNAKSRKETELNQLENVTLLPLDITSLVQNKETVTKAISVHNIGGAVWLQPLTDEE